jgi:hypothetical protein
MDASAKRGFNLRKLTGQEGENFGGSQQGDADGAADGDGIMPQPEVPLLALLVDTRRVENRAS